MKKQFVNLLVICLFGFPHCNSLDFWQVTETTKTCFLSNSLIYLLVNYIVFLAKDAVHKSHSILLWIQINTPPQTIVKTNVIPEPIRYVVMDYQTQQLFIICNLIFRVYRKVWYPIETFEKEIFRKILKMPIFRTR